MIREHLAREQPAVVPAAEADARVEVAVSVPMPVDAAVVVVSPPPPTLTPTPTPTSPPPPVVAGKEKEKPEPLKKPPVVVPRAIDAGLPLPELPGPPDAGPVPPLVPDAAPPEPDAELVELPQLVDAAVEEPPAPPPGPDPAWVDSMTRGIRDVVEAHRDVIEDCYRRAAREWTGPEPLAGRIDVHLTIVPSGAAEDVRVVENRTGSDALGSCLVTVMGTWRYPAPGDDAMEFIWPFNFRGQGGGAPREE
jgi:hypothetical protein